MKRIKLLTAIAIAAAMLSFAGCGEKTDSNTSVDDAPADSTAAVTEAAETTEAVSETEPETEAATEEPATEAPTEAEPEIDSMTFDDIQDIVEPILTGNTDTLDDMVATLSECGLEFDDEKDETWDGPEYSYVVKYLKTPVTFSDVDNLTVDNIELFKCHDNTPDTVAVNLTTGFTEDGITNYVIYENFTNYLLDNGCNYSETDLAVVNDRFSSIIPRINCMEGILHVRFEK